MTDEEIAARVIDASNKTMARGINIDGRRLSVRPGKWGVIRDCGKWAALSDCTCPLGALLLTEQPKHMPDESAPRALARVLERSGDWIAGFVKAIDSGDDNDDGSDGYVCGMAVRKALGWP